MKRFAALVAALCVAVCALGAAGLEGGVSNAQIAAAPVVNYASFPELKNFHFMETCYTERVAQGDNPILLFGSSEQDTSRGNSFSHMATLFGQNNYGMDVMCVGRATITDMWDVLEVGALAPQIKDKKVVLFPSYQWFMCFRNAPRDFPKTFSTSTYNAFMANPQISDATKQETTDLLATGYGVDRRKSGAGLNLVVNSANDAISNAVADFRLKQDLANATGASGSSAQSAPQPLTAVQRSHDDGTAETPDWKAIFAQADKTTAQATCENRYGFYDSWYGKDGKSYKKWLDSAKKTWNIPADGAFNEDEYRTFALLLKVCQENGIQPLVILQPANGPAYDQTVYTKDVRATWYARMDQICAQYGAQVADFSNHEYDKQFFYDDTHPSAVGYAYYSQAIYQYAKGLPLNPGAE